VTHKIDPRSPNYLLVYFFHHWMPQVSFFGTVLVYYGRHQALKSAVGREIEAFVCRIFCVKAMIDPKN
jgi:hypothetical protein